MYEIDEINEMDQINQIFAYSFCIMEGGGILRNNSDGEKFLKSNLTNLTTSPWTLLKALEEMKQSQDVIRKLSSNKK